MEKWATYWSGRTARDERGRLIEHIASDQFGDAGVASGDKVYVITYVDGHLHVVTSLVVGQLVAQEQAEMELGTTDLWEAHWHAIARPGTARRASMSARLSDKQVAALVFIGRDGQASPPARNRHGEIDPQTFRTTRRIDANSAAVLEKMLTDKP
jgi:hypothetical protein